MFIDIARIFVKAGDGGRGCVSFCREKYKPFGGPDGGRGGKGGDVLLEGTPHLTTLTKVARKVHYRARSGKAGAGQNRYGPKGEATIIAVPLGTMVREEETGNLLGDITEGGQQLVVAQGGHGGRGNKAFATSTNQVPREYDEGGVGEERWLLLELKLLADVGLLGFPNAGKSTLLSRLTSARPKVASYPFTTLNPHLGIVDFEDFSDMVIADIPGIIEGAHEGHGLGLDFLKHLERTSVLLHMVDGSTRDPLESYRALRRELDLFSEKLSKRVEIVAVTKMDLPESEEALKTLQKELKGEVFPLSAVTGQGLKALLYRLREVVREQKEKGNRSPLSFRTEGEDRECRGGQGI